MEWSAEGLIIGVRKHGETSLIVEAMVPERGRCLGLVRGGRSRRQAAFLQPGNSAQLTWRARLEDHLGTFVVEVTRMRAAELMTDRTRLYLTQLLTDHLRLLPERDPHDRLLDAVHMLLDGEGELIELGRSLALFEMVLLEELGFGLDLSACAVTGAADNLTHVSPRSGRAVCAEAAQPYLDRLLELPEFFLRECDADAGAIRAGFALTGHFLARHVWIARQIDPPATRDWLTKHLTGGL